MADKKIYIHISSDSEGSGVSANQTVTKGNTSTTSQKPKEAGKQDESNQILSTLLINEAKKVMSTAMSQFQNVTGNSIASKRMNAITSVASYATAIKAGGWVGAIYVATDIALKEAEKAINNYKANQQIELLRQRVGLSNVNGSRGTNG